MSITIKDVARQANVSVATVSRALNGHENVAEAVRSRVLAVAKELRYSPHHAARSLSSRRTNTIGVVLPDLYGEFFSELMRGIDQVAREQGLHLLVSSYHGNPEEQGEALRTMRGRVDGLLVMSPYGDVGALTEHLRLSQPAVLINSDVRDGGLPSIFIDNRFAAGEMVRHLAAGGRQRIAFIAGPSDNFDARDRQQGYCDALAEAVPGQTPWVVQGDFSEASGHRATLSLLQGDTRPDAIFAANDMMALGCLFACMQARVRVPHQIAIAGFDDIPLARYTHPGLTTMRVDIAGIGAQATRMLLERLGDKGRIERPAPDPHIPELIVRDSTASPPPDS